LCNVVDNPELGNVHTVGTIRRGDLLVSVSSNGKSPSLTRFVKEELEQYFSAHYAEVLEILHMHRAEVVQLDEDSRHQLISELLNNPERNVQELLKVFLHPQQNKGLQPLVSVASDELKAKNLTYKEIP
jgi:precorrin-2 dehydrogenase / sirohydrochlorin ferrochelatase